MITTCIRVFCICWITLAVPYLGAQTPVDTAEDYSNGALEMSVEHAKPQPGITMEGQNLYGILTIRVKNISPEPLRIFLGDEDCYFAIEIHDQTGASPRRTALGEHLPKTDAERSRCVSISTRMYPLEPGQETSVRWYINRLFFLEPGLEYSVKVTWVKGLPAKTPSGRTIRAQLSRAMKFR